MAFDPHAFALRRLLPGLALLALLGCQARYVAPEQPMPPKTLLISTMMRDLSAQPGFPDSVIAQLGGGSRKGPALLTPVLVDELRKRILGRDWSGLDRFPGWTMREINPTVRVAGHFAGKDPAVEDESAAHGAGEVGAGLTAVHNRFLDLGPYALDRSEHIDLNVPSAFPPFSLAAVQQPVGDGILRGDGPNANAPEHAASQRLVYTLNRLSANALDGVVAADAQAGTATVRTPGELIAAMQAAGFTVTVDDARYFANFAQLHYSPTPNVPPEDVMAPFWLNTRLAIPGTGWPLGFGARPLLVPASHAEYEWSFRNPAHPELNADVEYFYGIDGKSEWRTNDTLDQSWVLRRAAHTYTGAQAVEVTHLLSLLTVAYMHLHARYPKLPFGGYYALGVCQDGVAAVEKRMTGDATLFPNTADDSYFTDSRDAEVNAMIRALPKDRSGRAPDPKRIFGSLPLPPGPDGRFAAVTIPGLSDDLALTYAAWQSGGLHHVHRLRTAVLVVGVLLVVFVVAAVVLRRMAKG